MVQLYNGDLAWRVFTVLEAVEWRWTLMQVLDQPEALLDDVLTLAGLAQRVKKQIDDAKPRPDSILKLPHG